MKSKKKLFKDLRPLEMFKLDLADIGLTSKKFEKYQEELFVATGPNYSVPEQYIAMRVSNGDLWIFNRRSVVRSLGKKLGMQRFGKHEKNLGQRATVWITLG